MKAHVVSAAAVFATILYTSAAFGWGDEGHQIVASIAAQELTAKARAGVTQLLGGDPEQAMVTASTWADEIRPSRRETAPWHFVNIPINSSGYDAARDCPNNNCVVEQIELDKSRISDSHLLPAVRLEALRFLIHFVGDVHQPLHASNHDDRGGNMVRVIIDGETTNLHAVWDTNVVAALGTDAQTVAHQLESKMSTTEIALWQRGSAADWADGSFKIAKSYIYASLPGAGPTGGPVVLPADYADKNKAIAAQQLEKAGARLAYVLNSAFP